jgi:hypothetical protein
MTASDRTLLAVWEQKADAYLRSKQARAFSPPKELQPPPLWTASMSEADYVFEHKSWLLGAKAYLRSQNTLWRCLGDTVGSWNVSDVASRFFAPFKWVGRSIMDGFRQRESYDGYEPIPTRREWKRVRNMKPEEIGKLGEFDLKDWTKETLSYLTPDQMKSLSLEKLKQWPPEMRRYVNNQQLKLMTPDELRKIPPIILSVLLQERAERLRELEQDPIDYLRRKGHNNAVLARALSEEKSLENQMKDHPPEPSECAKSIRRMRRIALSSRHQVIASEIQAQAEVHAKLLAEYTRRGEKLRMEFFPYLEEQPIRRAFSRTKDPSEPLPGKFMSRWAASLSSLPNWCWGARCEQPPNERVWGIDGKRDGCPIQ